MKSCETIQPNVKAYLDGELGSGARLRTWWHLRGCPECREATRAMKQIHRRLEPEAPAALDPALRARILASVSYADSEGKARRKAPPTYLMQHRLLLLGGAAIATVIAAISLRPVYLPRKEADSAGAIAPTIAAQSNAKPALSQKAADQESDKALTPPSSPASSAAPSVPVLNTASQSVMQRKVHVVLPRPEADIHRVAAAATNGRTRKADEQARHKPALAAAPTVPSKKSDAGVAADQEPPLPGATAAGEAMAPAITESYEQPKAESHFRAGTKHAKAAKARPRSAGDAHRPK